MLQRWKKLQNATRMIGKMALLKKKQAAKVDTPPRRKLDSWGDIDPKPLANFNQVTPVTALDLDGAPVITGNIGRVATVDLNGERLPRQFLIPMEPQSPTISKSKTPQQIEENLKTNGVKIKRRERKRSSNFGIYKWYSKLDAAKQEVIPSPSRTSPDKHAWGSSADPKRTAKGSSPKAGGSKKGIQPASKTASMTQRLLSAVIPHSRQRKSSIAVKHVRVTQVRPGRSPGSTWARQHAEEPTFLSKYAGPGQSLASTSSKPPSIKKPATKSRFNPRERQGRWT